MCFTNTYYIIITLGFLSGTTSTEKQHFSFLIQVCTNHFIKFIYIYNTVNHLLFAAFLFRDFYARYYFAMF